MQLSIRLLMLFVCGFVVLAISACQPPNAPPPEPKAELQVSAAREARSRGDGTAWQGTSVDALKVERKVLRESVVPVDEEPEKKTPATTDPEEAAAAARAAAAESADKKADRVTLGDPKLTAGIPGKGQLTLEEIEMWLADPANHEVLEFDLPMGLAAGAGQIVGIKENPLTRAKIELGRQLYFDRRLSADESVSCASCHDPDEGYSRHTQFGIGIKQLAGGRNSPVSYNRILSGPQSWDGRATSLEDQAIGPIANAIEMGNSHEACVSCLKAIKGYRLQFEKIFGTLDIFTVGMALASFERAIVTAPSPFDYNERFRPLADSDPEDLKEDPELMAQYQEALAGVKAHPMSESAKRGREIFFTDKGSCTACHVGANLADEKYHNLGVGMEKPKPDLGRFVFSMDEKDRGAFKTPTIRNVALSSPYMHDGSIKTLEEVVEWYAKGGHPNPWLSDKIKKLDLTDQDKKDLVEFMKACTGPFPEVVRDRLPPKE